jgi:hypothetical protein
VVQLCPRSSSHSLVWDPVSVVKGWQITIWAMAGYAVWPIFQKCYHAVIFITINPLNAELKPICHLLAVHPMLHISRIRVNG